MWPFILVYCTVVTDLQNNNEGTTLGSYFFLKCFQNGFES